MIYSLKKEVLANLAFSLIVLAQLFDSFVNGNEVIGCGGFIKSNTEINYKIIKVKLLTKDGAVKYTTEASPVNGYYMIPIYNKGDYLLQVNPPLGWSFEPNQVSISIDGKNDPCSKNEDINFFFKGFGLSGKIVTQGDTSNEGPSGVKLTLIQNNKAIGSTQSGADGSYYFSNVMPGSYEVEAALDSDFKFLQSKVSVLLSKENWYAKENIIISGYRIQGTVISSDKTPIANAAIELHFFDQSFSNIDTNNFECIAAKIGLKICETKSDSNGKFSFSNVAFGKYKLKASLNIEDSLIFTMRPESIDVDLTKHKNILLGQSFQLDTVSINSIVVLSDKNKPLESGEVYINGKKLTVEIKKDGKFTIPKLATGNYKFEIKSKNAYFEIKQVNIELSSSSLKPNATSYKNLLTLTRFQAKSFDVCGKVKINNPNLTKELVKSVKINVYAAESPTLVLKSTTLNNDMEYCLDLDSNRNYVIKTELTETLAQLLRLVPLERHISVFDSALFDINFEQLEAKLDGQIRLISGKEQVAPKDLIVYLNSVDSKQSKEIQVKCVQVKDGPIECSFTLSKLLFGKYQLSTNYDNLFCWKQETRDSNKLIINIDSETQTVRIEQVGFKINVQLSHANANIKIVESAKKDSILYSKNILSDSDLSGSICLSQITNYKLLIDSCHKFTQNEPDTFEISSKLFTKDSNNIKLVALKHKLTVQILFKPYDLKGASFLKEADLLVEARTETQNELIKFKLKSSSNEELVFVGHCWFESNKPIKLFAKSDKVLFEQNNKVKKIDEFKCDSNLVEFEAKLGIFIVGTISPTTIDSIDLLVKSTFDNSTIEKMQINAAQGFKLGPYKAPFSLYSVELSKSGYLFTNLNGETSSQKDNIYSLNYQVEKLGQLKVNVVDAKLKTNLESVLMSLSSENRLFRQTIKTDHHGTVSFDNLKPGLYYLIVMYQEYEFNPNSHPIQITDGFNMNLVVEADRIAYSCFGHVTSINGRAEGDSVLVEAVGLKSDLDVNIEHDLCKSSRENAELDVGLGTYRIRNLKPNCVYELNVKSFKKDFAEQQQPTHNRLKIVPNNYIFKVNSSDILDRNFIVLNQYETVDVSISISTSRQFDNTDDWSNNAKHQAINSFVRVKLFKSFQPDNILSTQYSPANSILYLSPLDRDDTQQYAISVELLVSSTTSSSSGSITQQQIAQLQQLPVLEKTELSFYADSKHKHFQVKLDLDKKKSGSYGGDSKQQYQNFYFTLPLFIIAVGIFLNLKKVKEILVNLIQSLQQKGGLTKFLESFRNQNKNEPSQTGSSSTKVGGKTGISKVQRQPKDLSDNEKIKQSKPAKSVEPKPSSGIDADKNSDEHSESDYVDYTSEEGETLTIVKKRPRKV